MTDRKKRNLFNSDPSLQKRDVCGGIPLDVSPLPENYDVQQALKQLKQHGMLPIHGDIHASQIPKPTITRFINRDQYDLLEYCGDLLATNAITGSEWMKLKKLIDKSDEESRNMVQKILDAKSTQK